jgi:hypothetical protein
MLSFVVWRVTVERLKRSREAAPFVDILQEILDPHARVAGAECFTQSFQLT